jgi:hypothetical protein
MRKPGPPRRPPSPPLPQFSLAVSSQSPPMHDPLDARCRPRNLGMHQGALKARPFQTPVRRKLRTLQCSHCRPGRPGLPVLTVDSLTDPRVGMHYRPARGRREHAPRSVIVSEEKNFQRPCRSRRLSEHTPSRVRVRAAVSSHSNRSGGCGRQPLVYQPAQRPLFRLHFLLLQPLTAAR